MAEQEKAKGKAEEIKGRLKEGIGDAVDDTSMQLKGKAEKAKGALRQAKEKVKDAGKK
ncbi:CsbD family protein [Nonomuraea sediminis]|uniref:CsbD family protein n=1 Tax=Nonomuraea sediminis TaxID=2835864 RepID=UPI001BDC1F02|nr:CsbD family protein [Nonomuraea sediminis]